MKYPRPILLIIAMIALPAIALAAAPPDQIQTDARMDYLDNGVIRIGVDLARGGPIAWLGESHTGRNLLNVHDLGRYIQQSYYSGPQPFGDPNPNWKHWPWNPIGAGDSYRHPAKTLANTNDGKTLYVKTLPMQWALNNVPGDCTFETWIALDGRAAEVRCRLTNTRDDHTLYHAYPQETPAIYTVAALGRLMTYTGDAPFTNGKLTHITGIGIPWNHFIATERWAATVDDHDFGVGVYCPLTSDFIGGYVLHPTGHGPLDDSTGYIAPHPTDILDHNIVYEYRYRLIVGSLDQIRAEVYAHRPPRGPEYHFTHDRQHWSYHHAHDDGYPIRDHLTIHLDGDDPQIIGPVTAFAADDVPVLYLRAAFATKTPDAVLYWKTLGMKNDDPDHLLRLHIQNDGRMHTYPIRMTGVPHWRGLITRLRLDPTADAAPSDHIQLESLTTTPPPSSP